MTFSSMYAEEFASGSRKDMDPLALYHEHTLEVQPSLDVSVLSDDELLDVLKHTKDPRQLQPWLGTTLTARPLLTDEQSGHSTATSRSGSGHELWNDFSQASQLSTSAAATTDAAHADGKRLLRPDVPFPVIITPQGRPLRGTFPPDSPVSSSSAASSSSGSGGSILSFDSVPFSSISSASSNASHSQPHSYAHGSGMSASGSSYADSGYSYGWSHGNASQNESQTSFEATQTQLSHSLAGSWQSQAESQC